MTVFTIKIADINFLVKSVYESTKLFCKDYLTEEEFDYSVEISSDDIEFEQIKSDEQYKREGKNPEIFPNEYLETLSLYRKLIPYLLENNTILFHGSTIAVDNSAYLFTAPSGTGKSTHVSIWRKYFGEKAVMINDDKPLIKVDDEGIVIFGTPWMGKHNLGNNVKFPLKAICHIKQCKENSIKKIDKNDLFSILFQQTQRTNDKLGMQKVLILLEKLAANVDLYELYCNISEEAVEVSYKGMNGGY